MAAAALARSDPFKPPHLAGAPERQLKLEIIGLAVLGGAGYASRVFLAGDLQVFAWLFLGFIAVALLFKNLTYGLLALVVSVGLSPEFLGGLRIEDFLLPPLIFVWWLRHQQRRDTLVTNNIFPAIRVYLFFVTFGTLLGLYNQTVYGPIVAAQYYFKGIEYFVLFWLVFNNVKERGDLILVVVTSLVVCALVGYLSLLDRTGRMAAKAGQPIVRAFGAQGETPNVLGGYYLFHIMVAFSMVFVLKRVFYRVLLFAFLAGVVVPFLYTFSRTSFVSLVIGMTIVLLFIDLRFFILLGVLAIFIPLAFPEVTVTSAVGDEALVGRYQTIFDLFSPDSHKVTSWTARYAGWLAFIAETLQYSPLVGGGMGSIWLGVDSAYVKIFYESGSIGLITFFMVLLRLFRLGVEVSKKTKDDFYRSFAIGYIGGFAGFIVHAVGVSTFATIRPAEIFWIFSGLLVACRALVQRDAELQEEEAQDLEAVSFARPQPAFRRGPQPALARRPV